MRHNVVFFVAAFILCFSAAARENRLLRAGCVRMENQTSVNPALIKHFLQSGQRRDHVANRDQVAPNPQSDPSSATLTEDAIPVAMT
jgi:hypothetical protein